LTPGVTEPFDLRAASQGLAGTEPGERSLDENSELG
jgi:hypothetical protein